MLWISFIGYSQQSPSDFLGYKIGEQFTRHADVLNYFRHLADSSPMVNFQAYGKTNERRTLSYAVISTEENIKNLENIRINHLKNAGFIKGESTSKISVVWLSYNVHGNEASSTEAAMNTAYKLITSDKEHLKNTIVIIDPCVNPDGRDRYVNWYNQVKATPYNTHQDATEHHEQWPGGRPNHYLFDLNRDWAWATQVETQQRLKIYNKWMPHVHVDFHEQGINEPYYFAPAAEPFHEIITDWQRDFQTQIGKNHARYFDQNGWLYFTRELFDLLYPSYGDSYPTFMGAIGMTYEQAGHGRAGLGIDTDEGYTLKLTDRVAHHTTTGLSTIETSSLHADQLNSEFRKFFSDQNFKYKSYVMKGNPDKIKALTDFLDTHEISYGFTQTAKVKGWLYTSSSDGSMTSKGALVVSTNQLKGKMVKALFEPNAKLTTPITYDITAWSLPYAFGLETVASTTLIPSDTATDTAPQNTPVIKNVAGYIAKWNHLEDAKFLAALLKENVRVRFSEQDFVSEGVSFSKGSLIITKSDNSTLSDFDQKVARIASIHNRTLHATNTGFATSGVDFGSSQVKLINPQRIAVLKGKFVSSLSYGEIWHFFEQQLSYPITSIDAEYFSSIDLNAYDVLILPDGFYNGAFNKTQLTNLRDWIFKGGKIIAIKGANSVLANKDGFGLKSKTSKKETTTDENSLSQYLIPYDKREEHAIQSYITGSIFKTQVDTSHPMAFGYDSTYFSLKLGSSAYDFLKSGYNVTVVKGDAQNVSGFAGEKALAELKNSLIFGEEPMGQGSVVYMIDNPLFRSFWENGKLFFVNSIFFVNPPKYRSN